ncbi:hypothetical protein ACN3XK_17450, partial [Actinomadura welshii]
ATAAFAVVNATVWNIADALGPIRQAVLAVAALLAWLIIDHRLWERPDDVINRQRAKLYNAVTLATLHGHGRWCARVGAGGRVGRA